MSQVTYDRILLLGTDNSDGSITGVTTGTSQPIRRVNQGLLSFFFRSVGTTSGGTLLIEEADWSESELPYGGTWSVIATVLASSFTGGAQIAYHISDSSYGYVRVRISSAITGGGTVYVTERTRGKM